MDQYDDLPNYFPPYNIEIKEIGVWNTVDLVQELEVALYLASCYCQNYQEHNIRIVDKNNKII